MNSGKDAPILRIVEDVGFSYRSDTRHQYVLKKSFSLSAGDRVCIWGPNGCGKSTLLAMLAGLRQFDSGCIKYNLDEEEISLSSDNFKQLAGPSLWGRIGFAFQRPELLNSLSALDNLRLVLDDEAGDIGSELWGVAETQGTRETDAAEWNDVAAKLPFRLSGGQRQRIGIARAFGAGQSLVIIDEPTNNLDVDNRERAAKFLVKHSKSNALVVVSHEIEFLRRLDLTALYRVESETSPDDSQQPVKRYLRRAAEDELASFLDNRE